MMRGPRYRGKELDTYSVEAVSQATKQRGMQPLIRLESIGPISLMLRRPARNIAVDNLLGIALALDTTTSPLFEQAGL